MAQCSYIYANGLRIESGRATVDVDGRTLRVVRNGRGRSRLTRTSLNPPSDGEITLKDLREYLATKGKSTVEVTVRTEHGEYQAELDPAHAMGRNGRKRSVAEGIAALDPLTRRIAALHQLETLPYEREAAVEQVFVTAPFSSRTQENRPSRREQEILTALATAPIPYPKHELVVVPPGVVSERATAPLHRDTGGWAARYLAAASASKPLGAGSKFSQDVHTQWLNNRKTPMGNTGYFFPEAVPCIKGVGISGWIDIANTPYHELPPDWMGDNYEAAVAILDAVRQARDPESAAAIVHDRWLERDQGWAQQHQLLPYAELSESEKEKGRWVVRKALEAISHPDADERDEERLASALHELWRDSRMSYEPVRAPYPIRTESGWVDLANDPAARALLEERRATARAAEYAPETVSETAAELKRLELEAASMGVDLTTTFSTSSAADDVAGSLEDWCLKGASISAADAVIARTNPATNAEEVLVITRAKPPFASAVALPGGMVDPGEDFATAARRETQEEVGLEYSEAWQSLPLGETSASNWDPRSRHAHVGAVYFKVPHDAPIQAGDDAAAARWVPVSELASGATPIAFGHAEWLARAYERDPELGPRFKVLAAASKLRNTMLIREVNVERVTRGAERIPV